MQFVLAVIVGDAGAAAVRILYSRVRSTLALAACLLITNAIHTRTGNHLQEAEEEEEEAPTEMMDPI